MQTIEQKQTVFIHPDRQYLQELSEEAKDIRTQLQRPELPINYIIVQQFYTDEQHTDFDTRKGWEGKGYRVRTCERGFPVWGKAQTHRSGSGLYYPLSYVFSSSQVDKVS